MSRAEIPYTGRVGRVCDLCHQPGEAVAVTPCDWCGEDVCAECLSEHARECHDVECMCRTCCERRICAAESRRDAMEGR